MIQRARYVPDVAANGGQSGHAAIIEDDEGPRPFSQVRGRFAEMWRVVDSNHRSFRDGLQTAELERRRPK
jgi:hypothetical protein